MFGSSSSRAPHELKRCQPSDPVTSREGTSEPEPMDRGACPRGPPPGRLAMDRRINRASARHFDPVGLPGGHASSTGRTTRRPGRACSRLPCRARPAWQGPPRAHWPRHPPKTPPSMLCTSMKRAMLLLLRVLGPRLFVKPEKDKEHCTCLTRCLTSSWRAPTRCSAARSAPVYRMALEHSTVPSADAGRSPGSRAAGGRRRR